MTPLARFFIEMFPRLRGYTTVYRGPIMVGESASLEYEGYLRARLARAGVDPGELSPAEWRDVSTAVGKSHLLSQQLNRETGLPSFGPGVPGSGVGPLSPAGRQRYTVVVDLRHPDGTATDAVVEVLSRRPLTRADLMTQAMSSLGRGEVTTDPSGRGAAGAEVTGWRVVAQLTV